MNQSKNRNEQGELLTLDQACSLTNLGRDSMRREAERAGAVLKLGKCYRIHKKKLLQYFDEMMQEA